jgi:hypothetical protein
MVLLHSFLFPFPNDRELIGILDIVDLWIGTAGKLPANSPLALINQRISQAQAVVIPHSLGGFPAKS